MHDGEGPQRPVVYLDADPPSRRRGELPRRRPAAMSYRALSALRLLVLVSARPSTSGRPRTLRDEWATSLRTNAASAQR